MDIQPLTVRHAPEVLALYQKVARIPGGLARLEREVERPYVESFIFSSLSRGLGFVAISEEEKLIGEIHAYSPELFCFSHVLSDLTIAVDPDAQGTGVGRQLFGKLMQWIVERMPEISRVELIARESNEKAIDFYESLGFIREGIFKDRIRNADGSLEADIPMGWTRD